MECLISPPRLRMLFPTCFTLPVFLKHPSSGHNINQKRRDAEEPFLLHNCNSQRYHILSKYRFTSVMVPQVMNFHPNGSLKMVFDVTVSGQNHTHSLNTTVRGLHMEWIRIVCPVQITPTAVALCTHTKRKQWRKSIHNYSGYCVHALLLCILSPSMKGLTFNLTKDILLC